MLRATVVLLGDLSVATPPIEAVAGEFGWSVESAKDLKQLREIDQSCPVVAVLFNPQGFGLTHGQMLQALREAVPPARLIACHRFSDAVDWPELAETGAFHALPLPLALSEVRQSLGFVWSARLLQTAKVLPIRASERRDAEQVVAQFRDAS